MQVRGGHPNLILYIFHGKPKVQVWLRGGRSSKTSFVTFSMERQNNDLVWAPGLIFESVLNKNWTRNMRWRRRGSKETSTIPSVLNQSWKRNMNWRRGTPERIPSALYKNWIRNIHRRRRGTPERIPSVLNNNWIRSKRWRRSGCSREDSISFE